MMIDQAGGREKLCQETLESIKLITDNTLRKTSGNPSSQFCVVVFRTSRSWLVVFAQDKERLVHSPAAFLVSLLYSGELVIIAQSCSERKSERGALSK